jgi:hypothetical protein
MNKVPVIKSIAVCVIALVPDVRRRRVGDTGNGVNPSAQSCLQDQASRVDRIGRAQHCGDV